jgi:hypothetical protein
MEMKLDPEMFDKLQAALVHEIALAVRVKLHEVGLEGERLEDMTGAISSSIANILDDMAGIEVAGVEVRPYLTFRVSDTQLVHCGENSSTNDFIYAALKKLFSR